VPTSGRSEPVGPPRSDAPPPTEVVRLPSPGRQLPAVAILLLVAVVIAFLKPWDLGRELRPERAATAPTPTPPRGLDRSRPNAAIPPGAVPCFSDREWRVVTVERLTGVDRRSWIAVEPVAARGPTDRRIPTRRLAAEQLLAIGYCPPTRGAGAPEDPRLVALYHVAADERSLTRIRSPLLFAPKGAGTAEVYRPQPIPEGREGTWAAGRYVMQVAVGRATSVWFALEFVAVRPPRPQGPTPR
jgi:hypothetical protein